MAINGTFFPDELVSTVGTWTGTFSDLNEDIDTPNDSDFMSSTVSAAPADSVTLGLLAPSAVLGNDITTAKLRLRMRKNGGKPALLSSTIWSDSAGVQLASFGSLAITSAFTTYDLTEVAGLNVELNRGGLGTLTLIFTTGSNTAVELATVNLDVTQAPRPIFGLTVERLPGQHPRRKEHSFRDAMTGMPFFESDTTVPDWPHPHEGFKVATVHLDELPYKAIPVELPDESDDERGERIDD